MDLEFTDDDDELRANVRSVLASISPPGVVREVYEAKGDAGAVWEQMVELDWPGLGIAEEHGGVGMSFLEVAIVCDEHGRATAPGPYLATVTQYVPMVRELGGEHAAALLADVAAGRTTGTVALAEAGSWDPAAIRTTALERDGVWHLSGSKVAVLDGATADRIVVIARSPGTTGTDGLGAFLIPRGAAAATSRLVLDETLPVADLDLHGVVVPAERVLARPGTPGVAAAIERANQEATVALAVNAVGACRNIFEQTVEYAKQREQYGKLIGSFQALKHRMADMFLAVERASALAWFAVLAIVEEDPRRAEATSLAKAAASDCERLIVRDGLQLHGGIGYTWEHDLHFLLKRAKACDALYGSGIHHRARLAEIVGLTGPTTGANTATRTTTEDAA
jgi:alkylation response protein AidB-like acyl-CoA dehydrogenase